MENTRASRAAADFVKIWTVLVLLFIYLPVLCDAVTSLSKGRYFSFPVKNGRLPGGRRPSTRWK